MRAQNLSLRCLTRRAYTLCELLIVITVLGIAAALVIPSFGSTGVLRIQGAIRTVVSDLAIAQSDSIAYQKGRAIVFHNDPGQPRYVVCEVNGPNIDETLDKVHSQSFSGGEFGDITFQNITMTNGMIVFDELGGPVAAPQSSTPAPAQYFDIVGGGQCFRINIDAYTGKVTVQSLPYTPPPP
jgi:prepilin-type N-terminal cleavage/methylation domain-containing protein